MRRRFSPFLSVLLACGAVLALGACSADRGGGVGQSELDAERARAAAAEEALDALRGSLQRAQEALTSGGTGAAQRAQARVAVSAARQDLREARRTLAAQPDDAAKAAAGEALTAADTALERVDEALADADAMRSGSGPIMLSAMHTTLDRAQAALDDAQAKMNAALAANPSGTLRTLLAQAQATLAAAQVSLVPLLREELTTAERDAAAQRTRADAATARGDTEKARADAEKARADAENARADEEKARADAADAEIDRLTLSFGDDLKIGGPEASRIAPAADAAVALTSRRAGVTMTAETGFDPTGPWSAATRYAVADYGTANPDRLSIAQNPVVWSEGSGMVIPGASGSPARNEFPGRGDVFRGENYSHDDFQLARQGSYGPASDGTAAGDISRPVGGTGLRGNLRGHAISSFQYRDEGGLTMKFGGLPPDEKPAGAHDDSMGSLIYGDLERLAAKGTYNCGAGGDMACDETVTGDLTVSFGVPSRDPSGDPNYYWTVDVPNPKLALEIGETNNLDEANLAAPDSTIGRYEMLLSNHAGDGEDVYLRYAAYGLFQFIDYQTSSQRPGRMQTFHYGFDAFGDHNPLPAPTADSIAATFKGRTTAWLSKSWDSGDGFVGGLDRMRGNVTLHACIGGGGCSEDSFDAPAGAAKPTDANDIVGAIHDLEIFLRGGAWGTGNSTGHPRGRSAFLGDILLDGDINAGGAFSGTAIPDTLLSDSQRRVNDGNVRIAGPDTHGYTIRAEIGGNSGQAMRDYWKDGRFEGAFYGPREAAEAAGTWWLPASDTDRGTHVLGIIGSFGATAVAD